MKKKHVALLLSMAMVLSLTACGGSDAPAADETPAQSSDDAAASTEDTAAEDASDGETSDAAPANDTLVASVEQGLEGKFSPYFSLAANLSQG